MSSSSPSSAPQPSTNASAPPRGPGSEDERARQAEAAAMQRFAEVSLKSVPLPEGVDPNKRASVGEAAKTIKPEDLLKVHQAPCSREGFLTGIGSGAAVGFLRYIAGAPIPKSANWAVGSGVGISVLAYEYCQYKRRLERANMKRVVEVVTKKQSDVKKQEEEKQLQLKAAQEEAARKAAGGKWYKFW
ncbi:Cytochrome c oxidase protein 20, mitochondrial [Cytospora mali]|uniref:Cytochrome c oxidase assembly protein COX20, mitochondrial n=1 Tax=Cytospora mali TaxID=578113 RepID=A0A194W8S3_CYTMA|nr:Cytochrome c oxidase protein 20, mitochondrial [Valsa mali]